MSLITLRSLLKKYRYKDIFNTLHRLYYQKESRDTVYGAAVAYRRAITSLLALPIGSQLSYGIDISQYYDEKEEEGFIGVSLYNLDTQEMAAMDFCPWEAVIDLPIRDILLFMDELEMVAHILWEITFYGWTPEEVAFKKADLDDRLSRLKEGTVKLIEWEDIQRELGFDDESS